MQNNKEYEFLFEGFDKAAAFNELAKLFYDKNFSAASKSEIELLMFHFYMKATIEKYKNAETNVLDYKACSDYRIAQQLGITQEKVRNLKIKKQARYPEEFDWQKSLMSIKESIRYDELKKKIIIPMPDPNLYLELKNYIEDCGGYIEVQRSGNILQIRPEYYILLIYESVDEQNKQKIYRRIIKELSKKNPEETISIESRKEMANHILGIAENGLSILASLLDISNPLIAAIKGIFTK